MAYLPQPLPASAFGEMATTSVRPQAAWRFDYSVNPALYVTTVLNGGTVSVSESRAVLRMGGAADGSAVVETIRRLRYLPGVGALIRFTATFAPPTVDVDQIVGIGDAVDGFFIGYAGPIFGVLRRRAGVDTWTPEGMWSGAPIAPVLDRQLGNVYQIQYQWLGYGAIRFAAENPDVGTLVEIHRIPYANTSPDVSVLAPTFPLHAEITCRRGSTADRILYTPSALAASEGGGDPIVSPDPLTVHRATEASLTTADTATHVLLAIQNKAVAYAGSVLNRTPIRITGITLGRGQTTVNTETFRVYTTDPTTAIPLVYTDADTDHSPVALSTTATTITTGTPSRIYQLGANDTSLHLPFSSELYLHLGQTLVIAVGASGNQATPVSVTVSWEELF